jgi:predicted RNase H-like HicB family nuclease
MKYLVVIEQSASNYSGYLPDLPGCVATGDSPTEVMEQIVKAVELHLKGMEEDGLLIPPPSAKAEYLSYEKAS